VVNEVVKYDVSLNDVSFRKFNAKEQDLFFAICSKLKDRYTEEIVFSFDQLRELSRYNSTSVDRFMDDIEGTYAKLLNLSYGERTATRRRRFVLFTKYDIDSVAQTVTIGVNKEFQFLLNDFTSFVKFELDEYTDIASTYSKTLYRKLKQFRETGYYVVKVEEFRRLLDIPESYSMSDIDKRVLAPVKKELSPLYTNFRIRKIKARKQNKIDRLEFYFTEPPQEDLSFLRYNWITETYNESKEEKYKREKTAQENARREKEE